jgi:hypothetical protein
MSDGTKPSSRATAEAIAIEALAFLAAEQSRLGSFLVATGLEPDTIRAVAGEPGFLAAVIDHLCADESLLLAFAANRAIAPSAVVEARLRLSGPEG